MELNDFQSLINLPKFTFINLQYGDIKQEILEFNKNNNKIHTIESVDMYDDLIALAALLKNLNLFISTSNTTAHLAGALGVETWLIKPKNHASFFYWNQVSDQTPWYGSIKLYDGNKNTDKILEDIKIDLLKKFNLK
jgi:ADP-heptose:LPS heptosyltransferase